MGMKLIVYNVFLLQNQMEERTSSDVFMFPFHDKAWFLVASVENKFSSGPEKFILTTICGMTID